MASNIHSHQHLMGPALVAGGPTLKIEFLYLRFSTLATDAQCDKLVTVVCGRWRRVACVAPTTVMTMTRFPTSSGS